MTWREWHFYSEGLRKTQLKQWEHTRAINWMVYRMNSDPQKAEKNIMNWWPLPTDNRQATKRRKAKRLTKREFEEFKQSMR